jgi:hypothetical protein
MAAGQGDGQMSGWRDIATDPPPTNQAVQVYVPGDSYYGNNGTYHAMLVDMGTGKRWMTFGWAIGRDLADYVQPTHWQHVPEPPGDSP